jgi:hypothetical protein
MILYLSRKARGNERTTKDKKEKRPHGTKPHERLTVKGFTLEAKIKYHVLTCKTRVSTKLVRIKQSPTLPIKYPRGTQGFGEAGDYLRLLHGTHC